MLTSTCHSEYHKIDSVFLKTVSNAFIGDNKIDKEWKELNFLSKPNFIKAQVEYNEFQTLIAKQVSQPLYFGMDKTTKIDSIYCRDASIATDFGMIICRMGKEGRLPEPEAHSASYNDLGIPILGRIEEPGTLEGGDVCWLNNKTIAVGLSYRTNQSGIEQLKSMLEPQGITVVTVHLPHYKGPDDVFHLMSVLSPVDENLAVVYSPLLPIGFRDYLVDLGFNFIEVPDSEFESMGCNVLAVGPRNCIMLEGNPKTRKSLKNAGCIVETYQGDTISLKGGGGPTCLTRPYKRIV